MNQDIDRGEVVAKSMKNINIIEIDNAHAIYIKF